MTDKHQSPTTGALIERLEKQVSTCSDSYEAPSGKIMLRVWVTDMAEVLKLAREALSRPSPIAGSNEDEAYEIGKRDGYEQAVQDIDLLTGGDGEYRYCTNHDPDRHCPDADTMKQRIAERFPSPIAEPQDSDAVELCEIASLLRRSGAVLGADMERNATFLERIAARLEAPIAEDALVERVPLREQIGIALMKLNIRPRDRRLVGFSRDAFLAAADAALQAIHEKKG